MDPIEEIKSKVDIVSFVSEYLQLTRAGRNFKANCPFHSEKTPSFVVSPELGIWRCFGACGEGGDIFKFLMKMETMEFPEAIRFLAQKAGVKIQRDKFYKSDEREKIYEINNAASQFYHYLLTSHPIGSAALSFLKNQRGMASETINRFGLGFAPSSSGSLVKFLVEKKGYKKEDLVKAGLVIESRERGKIDFVERFRERVIFPLRDLRGNVLGFSGRVLPRGERGGISKYVNTPETLVYHKRSHLFGLDVTRDEIKKAGRAIVVEGEFDLLTPWQAGIRNIVAIKGSSVTEEQAKLLSRFINEIVLVLDSDLAGQHATKMGVGVCEKEGLQVLVSDLGGFKDPDEAVRTNKEKFVKSINQAPSAYDYFLEHAFSIFDARTSDGVRAISRELVPILSRIPDEILRAYYTKVLAQKLGIAQEAVERQIGTPRDLPGVSGDNLTGTPKSRRDVLEEHLFSLALKIRPQFLVDDNTRNIFKDPALVRAQEALGGFLKTNKKFSAKVFVRQIPAEIVDKVSSLLLLPDLESLDDEKALQELEKTRKELEIVDIQEKINLTIRLIREKEREKHSARREQEELTRLTRSLAKLKQLG